MFFIAGSSSSQRDHGPVAPFTCPRCRNYSFWRLVENISSSTVYFIPVSNNSQYILGCTICGLSSFLNPEQVQRAFYLRQFTLAYLDRQMSDEDYNLRLQEVRYLQ